MMRARSQGKERSPESENLVPLQRALLLPAARSTAAFAPGGAGTPAAATPAAAAYPGRVVQQARAALSAAFTSRRHRFSRALRLQRQRDIFNGVVLGCAAASVGAAGTVAVTCLRESSLTVRGRGRTVLARTLR
jgi:hypothetical protein